MYKRQGIGTELLRQAEHLSATLGCTRLTLICEDHLIPLYKKLGYTLDGINAVSYTHLDVYKRQFKCSVVAVEEGSGDVDLSADCFSDQRFSGDSGLGADMIFAVGGGRATDTCKWRCV